MKLEMILITAYIAFIIIGLFSGIYVPGIMFAGGIILLATGLFWNMKKLAIVSLSGIIAGLILNNYFYF